MSATSTPTTTAAVASAVDFVLEIIDQPASVFYNAHGGKKEGLTVRVGLFTRNRVTGAVALYQQTRHELPLQARLLYTSGAIATAIKSDDDLLNVIESSPIGADGEGRLKFRVEEVSNIHKGRGGDSGKFILELSIATPEGATLNGFDPACVATRYTDAFCVKSKNPSVFRKRKALEARAAESQSQSQSNDCSAPQFKRTHRSRSRSRSSSASSGYDSDDSACSCGSMDSHASANSTASATAPGSVAFPVHALAAMEWVSIGSGLVQCPCCHSLGPPHRADCALSAALQSAGQSNTHNNNNTTRVDANSITNDDDDNDNNNNNNNNSHNSNSDRDDDDADMSDDDDATIVVNGDEIDDFLSHPSLPVSIADEEDTKQHHTQINTNNNTHAHTQCPGTIDESPIDHVSDNTTDLDSSTNMDFWMVHGLLERRAVPVVKQQQQRNKSIFNNSTHHNNHNAFDLNDTFNCTGLKASPELANHDDFLGNDDNFFGESHSNGSIFHDLLQLDVQTVC